MRGNSPKQLTLDQALALAGQLQGQGKLAEAEHWLRQILQQQPNHAPALQLLGVVAYQAGNLPAAAELIQRAIAVTPSPTLPQREREQSINSSVNPALFHANLCEILRRMQRMDEAHAHGERATALAPNMAMAHSNLGIVHYDRKEYEAAEKCQQRALQLAPAFTPALNNLGNIYREQGDKDKAMTFYRKAHAADVHYLEPISNLGALLLEEDEIDEAEKMLQQALQLAPNYPEAICNLGGVMLAREQNDAALVQYQRALQLRPVYAEAQMGLSKTLQALEQLPQAESAAQRAVEMAPENAKAHALLASVLNDKLDGQSAQAEYEKALVLDANCEEALLGMGDLHIQNGKMELAESLFRKSLVLKPDSIATRIHLVQVKKVKSGDANFESLRGEENQLPSFSDNKQLSLHFALGKGYDDIGEHDKAFPHFLAGCKQKRSKFCYDAEAMTQQFQEITTLFNKSYLEDLRGCGDASALPIFVLGMPRSGTTLTEQIIASHPEVFGAGELPDLLRIAHRKTTPELDRFPDNLQALNGEYLSAWGAEYIAELRKHDASVKHITDKMPANFFMVGLIHVMLPNAKIIHVNRNPVDTCVSCFTHLFKQKQEHTYDLAELGRYYRDYGRLMQHWRSVLPADALLDVQYEDIVADKEKEARRLLAFCNLEWDAACLNFHKTERTVRTASVTQVRQPIYTSSVDRWRKYEKHLGPLLEALEEFSPKYGTSK
jgi:tetratricopeptide (TPR) repeat protein